MEVFADVTQELKSLGRASQIQEYEAGDYLMKQVSKPNPGVVLSSTHACNDTDMPVFMYTFVHICSGSGGLGLYLITCQGRKFCQGGCGVCLFSGFTFALYISSFS